MVAGPATPEVRGAGLAARDAAEAPQVARVASEAAVEEALGVEVATPRSGHRVIWGLRLHQRSDQLRQLRRLRRTRGPAVRTGHRP